MRAILFQDNNHGIETGLFSCLPLTNDGSKWEQAHSSKDKKWIRKLKELGLDCECPQSASSDGEEAPLSPPMFHQTLCPPSLTLNYILDRSL